MIRAMLFAIPFNIVMQVTLEVFFDFTLWPSVLIIAAFTVAFLHACKGLGWIE